MVRLILPLLLLACAPVAAETPHRSVTVRAEGYVESIPDTLKLAVSVKQTAKSQDAAMLLVNKIVPQVLQACTSLGIRAEDIDSSRLSAYPEYEWRQQERIYLGETVTRNISITVRDLDQYGPLMSRLGKLRLHNIQNPVLSHSGLDQLRLDALKVALARGKLKADTIAGEINAKLGEVIWVRENLQGGPAPRMLHAEMASSRKQEDGGFSYARQRIAATVEVQYELK